MTRPLLAGSLVEFIDHVSRLSEAWQSDLWFRGQADAAWALTPGLYRADTTHGELLLREEFKRRGLQLLPEKPPTNDWEWYFLMQHYGMPTRLLDWSDGGLFGLYFALRKNDGNRDAAVWALDPYWLNKVTGSQEVIFFAPEVTIDAYLPTRDEAELPPLPVALEPPHLLRRIAVQRSCFTLHGGRPDSLEDILATHGEGSTGLRLEKIIIPSAAVPALRRDLSRCGIVETSVFPDLDGLSRELKWRYTSSLEPVRPSGGGVSARSVSGGDKLQSSCELEGWSKRPVP